MKLVYEEIALGHTSLIFSKIKDKGERTFYLEKAQTEAWSRSILEEKIRFDLYANYQQFQSNFDKTLSSQEVTFDQAWLSNLHPFTELQKTFQIVTDMIF